MILLLIGILALGWGLCEWQRSREVAKMVREAEAIMERGLVYLRQDYAVRLSEIDDPQPAEEQVH